MVELCLRGRRGRSPATPTRGQVHARPSAPAASARSAARRPPVGAWAGASPGSALPEHACGLQGPAGSGRAAGKGVGEETGCGQGLAWRLPPAAVPVTGPSWGPAVRWGLVEPSPTLGPRVTSSQHSVCPQSWCGCPTADGGRGPPREAPSTPCPALPSSPGRPAGRPLQDRTPCRAVSPAQPRPAAGRLPGAPWILSDAS